MAHKPTTAVTTDPPSAICAISVSFIVANAGKVAEIMNAVAAVAVAVAGRFFVFCDLTLIDFLLRFC